ncbi:MAG: S46 family peptidase, partial [Myxococcales bacterium]
AGDADEPPLPPARPKTSFENPGGMWMPQQLGEHAAKLKELGLEIDPAQLTDPTSKTLSAVVSLGGCSASFVSPKGLIVTNHHCVQGALQVNSTPEKNRIRDGFLARTMPDELSAGPTARVFVTRSFKDVTTAMLDGLEREKSDRARFDKLEARTKQTVTECEKGKTGVRCSVAKFFDGAQYFLIEQLELRDIRLVYAPHESVGNYGGEVDNWRWPRHTGDFSFYRAYVGPDGNPADFNAANVPYQPPSHLKLASKPLEDGDLVFVAGYPGRTSRYKTAAEVREAVEWTYPRFLKLSADYLAAIAAAGQADKEAGIRGTTIQRGLDNYQTNTKGQLEGLIKGGLAAQKERTETELKAWITADKERTKKYGDVLARMEKLHTEAARHREADASMGELLRYPSLIGSSLLVVRMAEERPKADADRKPGYQERDWKRLSQRLESLDRTYNRTLDKALLTTALERLSRLPERDGGELLRLVTGQNRPTPDQIKAAVDRLYAAPKMEDAATRQKLLTGASTEELRKLGDPLVDLALKLRVRQKAEEDRDEAQAGAMSLLRPRYLGALRELAKGQLDPDANGTLRITYGTVRGYQPKPDAPAYAPFTLLPEVLAKNTGKTPFDAPKALLDAAPAAATRKNPYRDRRLNAQTVDFLADLHITGGNSGSATLNSRGELTGLVFDGNYEAMASDWVFTPAITRSIHVDARYMLWVMDAVDQADNLLVEMGVTPKL